MKILKITASILLVLLVNTCSAKLVNAEVTVSNFDTLQEFDKRTDRRANRRIKLRKDTSRLKATTEE